MIRLPLEHLLEQGFEALSVEAGRTIELGRRVYGEELLAGASVDDALTGNTVANHMRNAGVPAVFHGSFYDLTEVQRAVLAYEDSPPFFIRTSGEYKGWSVEYMVDVVRQQPCYGGNADYFVREGMVGTELLHLQHCGSDVISIGNSAPDDRSVFVVGFDDQPPSIGSIDDFMRTALVDKQDALDVVTRLEGRPFDPVDIYRAVFNFLKA